jgi:hypothetical protein
MAIGRVDQAKLQPCPLSPEVEPGGDVVGRQRRKTSLRQPQGPALLLGLWACRWPGIIRRTASGASAGGVVGGSCSKRIKNRDSDPSPGGAPFHGLTLTSDPPCASGR